MSKIYKNSYTPPKIVISDYHPDTPEDEYDHNFVFDVKALRSDRVELRPFIVSSLLVIHSGTPAETLAITTLETSPPRSSECP